MPSTPPHAMLRECPNTLVSAGDPLGTVDGAPLHAPCDGVFTAVDRDAEHTRVTLRRLVP